MLGWLLYNALLLLLSPLIALYLLQRYFSGKSRPGWAERWGRFPESLRYRTGGKPRVWIHAVSAGEVVAAVPILREMRRLLPEHEFFLSVLTPAGHEMATQQASPYVNAIFYLPFDFPWVVARAVRFLRPVVFVSLESEIWPNLLFALHRQGAKTVMVNGRISERSFRRSRRVGWVFRWALRSLDQMLMQSEADAERIRALAGGMLELGRVAVLGNSKFDQAIEHLTPDAALALRRSLKFPDDAPIFVAGSTRSAEEEREVLFAYGKMREAFPTLCLLIAPRQLDRAEEVANALRSTGWVPVRRTQVDSADAPVQTLILDTMGELANVYAIATFAFVGNSLPPVVKGGGQNLLQPLAHGKPVLFGPHIATIRSEAALAMQTGVGFQIAGGEALAQEGLRLLQDDLARREIEEQSLALIAAQRGVSARYAEAVVALAQAKSH